MEFRGQQIGVALPACFDAAAVCERGQVLIVAHYVVCRWLY